MRASDAEWTQVESGHYCREIPEGALMLHQSERGCALILCASAAEVRVIAHGLRDEVEQDARDVILFGLPGGTERRDGSPWRFVEGSLRHVVGKDSFRLMLRPDGHGALVSVHHDGTISFLGEERVDELARTADARLQHEAVPLHAWFSGRRLPLRGLGVVGVVGLIELARDVHLVLVYVDHDRFELYVAIRGVAEGLVGVYTAADLRSGDLGALRVASPMQQAASRPAAPTMQDMPSVTDSRTPRRESPVSSQSARTRPRPSLVTDEDRRRLETCLTPRRMEYTGAGALAMQGIYRGFRLLADEALQRAEDAFRLYAGPLHTKTIRRLLEDKLKGSLPGCARTFTRGLMRFLGETGLGERVGRRIQLHLGDQQRLVAMLRANYEPAVAAASPADPPTLSDRQALEADAPWGTPPPNAWATASPSTSPHSDTRAGEPPVGDQPEPGAYALDPWQPTLRPDGQKSYYQRRYWRPDKDSPSQFPGVKARDPPDD